MRFLIIYNVINELAIYKTAPTSIPILYHQYGSLNSWCMGPVTLVPPTKKKKKEILKYQKIEK